MSNAPLLIEIGIEEIPAGVSKALYEELCEQITKLLEENDIDLPSIAINQAFTPRRLLIYYNSCPIKQPDKDEVVWGPPEKIAFDADGKPTKAAEGFAKKSALSVDEFTLEDKGDGGVRYMKAVVHRNGQNVVDILAEAMPGILRKLSSPKRMKWNDGDTRDDAFIRPVRWIVARLGDEVIPFEFAGVKSGKISRGHRIAGSTGEMDINDPKGWLEKQHVMLQQDERIGHIKNIMSQGEGFLSDDELLEEVADLTEWPVPIKCSFKEEYLRLPPEVIRITLKNHQRCFLVGGTSNEFFAVANVDSKDPSKVAEGNARVVNARLADAAFYYDRDPAETLDQRVKKLNNVVFQDGLGMVGDQVARLRILAPKIASSMEGGDATAAGRAAYLCKSDLTTGLVYEFPELQGYMGGQYAKKQGESDVVANAIDRHYEGNGSLEARSIAIAENIDKLLGYFQLGKIPTASADPFGLRRSAIRLVEMLTIAHLPLASEMKIDAPVEMSLKELIRLSATQWNEQRITVTIAPETENTVYEFIIERLLNYDWGLSYEKQAIEAALHASIDRPLYKSMEIARLLSTFSTSETGQAVAAANKRLANILKKAECKVGEVNSSLFCENAEKTLFAALEEAELAMPEQAEGMLKTLAILREPVDAFFDDVMVMAEDDAIKANRLALLARLRVLFLKLADVSRLA